MSVKESFEIVTTNPKIGAAIATGTTSLGIFDWFGNLPLSDIATVVGIVLSLVLIYTHWRKGRAEVEKIKLETKLLLEKEERRAQEAARRKEAGQPTRRAGDQD